MKLKTKLLPICGALASTAAIVTPLATSCSGWVRYTDMLHEYKPGVTPYEETLFDEDTIWYDVDELYWARFVKNTDILRDDMLWSTSKVVCFENSDQGTYFKHFFKEIQKYNFDIHVDEIIKDDEDTDEDESAINFTIDWEFRAEFNESTKPEVSGIFIDVVDIDMQFKTIEPWAIWFDYTDEHWVQNTNSPLYDQWVMTLERKHDSGSTDPLDNGIVCISSDNKYRYSAAREQAGTKWENGHEHRDARDLAALMAEVTDYKIAVDENTSAYAFFYLFFVTPLVTHVYDETADETHVNWIPFCSHYLENVDFL